MSVVEVDSVAELAPRAAPRALLPAPLKNVPTLQLYDVAKQALLRCERVDEAVDWGNKAVATAVFARQFRDRDLEMCARRIRVRACRRAGELLLRIPAQRGVRSDRGSAAMTRSRVAEQAGLSRQQHRVAIEIALLPQ